MTEITCAMWNCSGFLSSSSAKTTMEFLKSCTSAEYDILILIETHHKTLSEVTPLLHSNANNNYILHTEASEEDPYECIVVLVSSKLEVLEDTTLLSGRLLNSKVKGYKKLYNITAVYERRLLKI